MPFATLLRSVPLIAMAPIIILIFGFGTDASVAVIGGIVVLFPALVTIAFGLKSASPQMLDVISVYGGNVFTAVRKVALPGALPSLFAAIRISVPGAVTGALLAEMLSTGDGIGSATATYAASARFTEVWACVVVVTVISLLIYTIVQVFESIALTRMGMNPDRRS
jgi:ABC-type nitrate/sulfonate/bicarbonate transport system permease component